MRNTGDLRLVSGLDCGGIYCFLLLSEWKEVTPSLLNSQIIIDLLLLIFILIDRASSQRQEVS